jgi:hypothetical protein
VLSVSLDKIFGKNNSRAFDKAFHVAFNGSFTEAWMFAEAPTTGSTS